MITFEQKAVALLRLLGTDVRDAVLSRLEPARASQLREQLEAGAPVLPARKQLALLEEFEQIVAMVDGDRPALRLHQPEADDEPGVATAAFRKPAATTPAFQPSGDHLADLERINAYQVAGALEVEQPRSIAAVLTQLSAERTAELLSLLSEAKREAVVRSLSTTSRTHPVLVERMAETILVRAMSMPTDPPVATDRLQRLAAVLRAVDRPMRRRMLDAIRDQDSETAGLLLERLYDITDLARLKDRQVQRVLSEIDTATISTALFGAEESLREKVMSNLSRRAREALAEEMSFQSDVPSRLVEEARKAVAVAIAKLDSDD